MRRDGQCDRGGADPGRDRAVPLLVAVLSGVVGGVGERLRVVHARADALSLEGIDEFLARPVERRPQQRYEAIVARLEALVAARLEQLQLVDLAQRGVEV